MNRAKVFDIERERQRRIANLITGGSNALDGFSQELGRHEWLADGGQRALRFAMATEYRHPGQSSETYLAHPLRVGTLYLEHSPGPCPEGLTLALLHNVLEVGRVERLALEEEFGIWLVKALELLNVDRGQERDAGYKEVYYSRIGEAERHVGEVKVLDKLDNLFLLCLNPDKAVRENYLAEIEQWVLPLAARRVPGVLDSMRALVEDNRARGYRPLEEWKGPKSNEP
ncbi:MAG: hypothetical protein WB992_12750 [Bryobacteraceae bacterium]